MILANQRHLFDLPGDSIYMNCASLSPVMKSVKNAAFAAIEMRSNPATIKSANWFKPVEELRNLFAKIIHAEADNIAVIPAVSYGTAIAAKNISLKPSQKILVVEKEFPSNYYIWQELAKQSGAELISVSKQTDENWTAAILRNIDTNTGLIAIPNCHWTDGSIIDLTVISEKAKTVRSKLVIDASQSLCAYPLDIEKIKPDFLVSTGYKWQLGAYGLGYLYVDSHYCETGSPLELTWINKKGAEDFTSLVDYRTDFRDGARRFDMGESPGFINVAMANAALTQILAWGIDSIQATIALLTNKIEKELKDLDLKTTEGQRVGHIIGVYFPSQKIPLLTEKLSENNISVSFRGSSMRISPYLFNDLSDVDKLISVIKHCVK